MTTRACKNKLVRESGSSRGLQRRKLCRGSCGSREKGGNHLLDVTLHDVIMHEKEKGNVRWVRGL